MDSSFFVAISFVFFLYLLYKYVWPSFIRGLDGYIQEVRNKLSSSKDSLELQKKLNQEYQNNLENLPAEITTAKTEFNHKLKTLKQNLEDDFNQSFKNKTIAAKQTIERLQTHHAQIIKEKLSDAIFQKIEDTFKENATLQNNYMNIALDSFREDKHKIL